MGSLIISKCSTVGFIKDGNVYKMKKSKLSMKRGVSPLIAYVFLVALAVSIGMLVISALIDRTQQIDLGQDVDYCKDISISLDNACRTNGILKVDITNNGAFTIYQVTLGKETNVSSSQSCLYPEANFSSIAPGESSQILLSLNASFSSSVNGSLPVCHAVDNGVVDAAKITIVPWIKPEGDEIISCTDQKIVWSKDLNIAC